MTTLEAMVAVDVAKTREAAAWRAYDATRGKPDASRLGLRVAWQKADNEVAAALRTLRELTAGLPMVRSEP